MKNKNKKGAIVDRRFGENDPQMSLEDKMLERFAREKRVNCENDLKIFLDQK